MKGELKGLVFSIFGFLIMLFLAFVGGFSPEKLWDFPYFQTIFIACSLLLYGVYEAWYG